MGYKCCWNRVWFPCHDLGGKTLSLESPVHHSCHSVPRLPLPGTLSPICSLHRPGLLPRRHSHSPFTLDTAPTSWPTWLPAIPQVTTQTRERPLRPSEASRLPLSPRHCLKPGCTFLTIDTAVCNHLVQRHAHRVAPLHPLTAMAPVLRMALCIRKALSEYGSVVGLHCI